MYSDSLDLADEWEADGWARHHESLARHTRPVTERMLELLDVAPGQRVLELCAGLGELSTRIAGRVAPGGEVICSDTSPGMVAAARARAASAGPGLRFEVLDAWELPLDDASVDAVVCKMGLMFARDPVAALAGIRRVLRPGGSLVVSTWGPPEHNSWILVFGAAMLTHGHRATGDPNAPGGIFSLSDRTALRDVLTAAGFAEVEVEAVDTPDEFDTFDDYWELRADTSGPLTAVLRQLDDDDVATLRATCREYTQGLRRHDGGYRFPGCALVAVAH